MENSLTRFNHAWRSELLDYVKRRPGGEEEGKTQKRLELLFRSPFVARVAGRLFLYGEWLSLGTLARTVWPSG